LRRDDRVDRTDRDRRVSSTTLLRGGCVLTLGARTPNYTEADVLIEDGRISEVGQGLRSRDAEQVDATGTIVMPGFVDTHRHAWRTLVGDGGIETDAPFEHLDPDDLYASTLFGLLGAVEAGITTVVDWCDPAVDEQLSEAAIQAHADAGLRTVYVHPADAADDAVLRRLVESGTASTTTIAYGAAASEPDLAMADELGIRVHAHAGVGTRRLRDEIKARLGADLTLVHCTDLEASELDAIASSATGVSLTPAAEMGGGIGAPPVQNLIDRGIRPGLGIGDVHRSPGDLFAQMRAVISIQHATLFDRKLAGRGGLPKLLTTRDVIRYATSDGATVAGLGSMTGSLEPGMQADVIVLRADRPNIAPLNDPIGAVVWGMDTSNIDWVFVAGRALMRSGTLQADVAKARALASEARQRLTTVSGLVAGTAGRGGEA
jgi:5-methylthioadenosine/S-adenosylhomocysteine deaminase